MYTIVVLTSLCPNNSCTRMAQSVTRRTPRSAPRGGLRRAGPPLPRHRAHAAREFAPWLTTIAKNTARDYVQRAVFRSNARGARSIELRPRHRRAFVLREMEGRDYDDIADLDSPPMDRPKAPRRATARPASPHFPNTPRTVNSPPQNHLHPKVQENRLPIVQDM